MVAKTKFGSAFWSFHFGLGASFGPVLAPKIRKKSPFWCCFWMFSFCLGLVFWKYMLLDDSPEGFSVVPARHTAREPHRCARTFQGTAKNMAHESFYRKTARQTSLHLRHGALHAADMVMLRHLYIYSPGTTTPAPSSHVGRTAVDVQAR